MSEITLRPEKHLQKNGEIRKAKKEGKKWNHSEEELGIEEGVRKEEEEKKKRIEKLFKIEIGGGGGGGEALGTVGGAIISTDRKRTINKKVWAEEGIKNKQKICPQKKELLGGEKGALQHKNLAGDGFAAT